MSIQINQYLMYGVLLTWDQWDQLQTTANPEHDDMDDGPFYAYQDDSAFNDKIGGKDGIFALVDGMSGKYVCIGKVIEKSSDGEYIGNPPIEIKSLKRKEAVDTQKKLLEIFGIQLMPSYYLITHYR